MPDGSLTIVAKPHPLQSDRVYCHAEAGQTIAQLLGDASHSCEVTVGGYPVPREVWGKVRPKAGQTLHVAVYPQGGSGDNKYLRTALLIALTIYAPALAGNLTASGGLLAGANASLVAGGIMAVGSLAINALVPPPTPKLPGGGDGDPFKQLASLTGTSNQVNPYGSIPCVVGTKRFFPPHAAMPYTEISGDDQYLRILLDLGYGDLEISDIKIGGRDIGSYEDAEWEISTTPTLFCQDVYEQTIGTSLVNAEDTDTRATQQDGTEISLDIVFPSGLYGIDANRDTVTGLVEMHIQYRPVGTTDWLGVCNATGLTVTGNADFNDAGYDLIQIRSTRRKTLRVGVRWTVPEGQYEVRVIRGNSSFSHAGYNGAGGTAVVGGTVGGAQWSVLRSISPQLPSTTGTNKLAIRVKATDEVNGVVQSISVLASQKIRALDPVTLADTSPAVTTNPAWIYLWLMTQCEAVVRRVTDARMDLSGIVDWAAECEAKSFAIGFVMDSPRAFGDIIHDVLAAGRASRGMRNGKYSAVRDIAQTVPVQMFTPANSSGFSYSRSFIEPPHALRVKFTNPAADDQQDVRLVYADGYSEDGAGGTQVATRFEELDLSMVINPDAAWRLGRYHLAVLWNRPTQYSLPADMEHMVCERGDLIHVAHDITGWGAAWGRVKAVNGLTVTLDGPVTLEAGKTYQIQVRSGLDGEQAIATITSTSGEHQTLTLDAAIGAPGDLFVLGEVNRGVAKLIVRAIEPGDDFTATLTCVDAAPAVLDADSGTPPPFVSQITGKFWCEPPAVPDVLIWAADSAPDDAGVIHVQTGVDPAPSPGIHRPGGASPGMGGGGSGGGSCVVVESFMEDGRRASDVVVGDTLALADEHTLEPRKGLVSYAAPTRQPCVEITTASGVRLRCSTSAPIPTPQGCITAPNLAGHQVAVRDTQGVRWEPVARIRAIGRRMVQHITVEDSAFWAGVERGRFVLHHNKIFGGGN